MDKLPPAYVSPMSKRSARGQSLVEFALTLPILLLILVGVVDLGRVYYSYMTVINASREGARYGAAHPIATPSEISVYVQREADGIIVKGSDLMLVPSPSCSPDCKQGSSIRVNVSYQNFRLITSYILGGGTIPLSAFTEMEIFGQ